MINSLILIIMCIARMIYLVLPTLIVLIVMQAVIYKLTGISPINKIIKILSR